MSDIGLYNIPPTVQAVDKPQILAIQTPTLAPSIDGLVYGTNLLNIPPRAADRLDSLSEAVYDLSPTSHLVKFLKVLTGDAGAGQLRKRMMLARMSTIVQGANFYDLDSFYGALFNLTRQSTERLSLNPYTDVGTADEWSSVQQLDSYYRARIDQFGKAVSMGASAIGMELLAEAILQTPCTIQESWTADDSGVRTYLMIQNLGGLQTYGELQIYTYGNLESDTYSQLENQTLSTYEELQNYTYGELENYTSNLGISRNVFTVVPHRAITNEETYSLRKVLNLIKPADSVLNINSVGWNVHTPVTSRGVFSDSEFWHFTKSVIPSSANASYYTLSPTVQVGGWQEVLTPVFSQYQGEQVSYGGDINLVSSYEITPDGVQLPNPVVDAYTFLDGTTLYYPPNFGVMYRFQDVSGRVVSDAILTSVPYSDRTPSATNAASTGTSPDLSSSQPQNIFVDGVPILSAIEAIVTATTGSQIASQPADQRFWSTPPRFISDATVENLEVSLVANRLINYVNFELAHFPQQAVLQVWDETTSVWDTVWTTFITDSSPSVIPIAVPEAHEHPQHSGPGAWIPFNVALPPTTSHKIRLQLTRLATGTPPVEETPYPRPFLNTLTNPSANQSITEPVSYSLGVQALNLGYLVQQEDDLPQQPLITTDFLGSQVKYAVRTEPAVNATNGGGIPWRCSPQPTSDSVVNFYVDTRDHGGNAQVVDSFYIDPLFIGPHCNIYFSNDDTTGVDFSVETTPLVPPTATPNGTLTSDTEGLIFPASTPAYVDISNTAIQFDPSQPWWLAVTLRPAFNANSGNGQTVWDLGNNMTLAFGASKLTLAVGLQSTTIPTSFTAGTTLYLSVSYYPVDSSDYQAGIYLTYSDNTQPTVFDEPLVFGGIVEPIDNPFGGESHLRSNTPGSFLPTTEFSPPTDLRFGGMQNTPVPANFKLLGVMLKQQAAESADIEGWANAWQDYTLIPTFSSSSPNADGTTDPTTNSILLFSIEYLNSQDTTGFVGGPGDFWPLLHWTPVARDYTVAKGFMEFNPTLAKFWKFEFTNLVAQQFNSFLPITKTVNTHQGLPAGVVQAPPTPNIGNPGAGGSGISTAINLAETMAYTDTSYISPFFDPPSPPNVIQPTVAQTALDITTQQNLSSIGWQWQFQNWAHPVSAPRFVGTGIHNYQTQTIVHSNQVSYFMGLNSIEPYRTQYTADFSPTIYDEFFLDDLNFISVLEQNPGDINSAGLSLSQLPLSATSVVFPSNRAVTGIQYATSQSDAVQIAYNDNFVAPFPSNYDWTGASQSYTSIRAIGDAVCSWNSGNNTVLVSRNSAGGPTPAVPTPGAEGLVERITFPIAEAIDTLQGAPTISSITVVGSGATTYSYELVALTPSGLTPPSPIATCTNGTLSGTVTNTLHWTAVPGATAYYVYGRTGNNTTLLASPLAGTATSYTDQGGSTYSFSGGLASASGLTGKVGYIWAAARVTVPDVLSSGLVLQLVDQTTSTVVAQTPIVCGPGQTVTAYVGYQLGTTVTAGGPVFAQIVQNGPATDTFIVDRLSVFDDGMQWQFSNDGGTTWVTGVGVKNKPYGLVSFPSTTGNQIRWKLTMTRPGMHVNALRIRPVYAGVQADDPQGILQGPNLSVCDHTPPISEDPMFQTWSNPIPYWWYPISSDYPALGIEGDISPVSSGHFYERLSADSIPFGGDSAARTIHFHKYPQDIIPTSDRAKATVARTRTAADGTHISNADTATATHSTIPPMSDIVQPTVHDID